MHYPDILIVRSRVDLLVLTPLRVWHKQLVKGVVDVERGVIALGGDWHMDANVVLLADGSEQQNVWGFNVYPDEHGDKAIEYISLINIRPGQGNREMEVVDPELRLKMKGVVASLLPELFV
jgi:hypothetical protein